MTNYLPISGSFFTYCGLVLMLSLPGNVSLASQKSADSVLIPAGEFSMGSDDPLMKDANPWHLVKINAFLMDVVPVTNDHFAKFVKETGYLTISEQTPKAADFPGAPPENLVPGSVIFTPPDHKVPLNNRLQWWAFVKGADWRHPRGPDSNLEKLGRHPVVNVAWDDAVAFCKWAGKRLPTEAEFERAARGGLEKKRYAWGDELRPGGRHMANIWQGSFPNRNIKEDGYQGTSPVGHFPANGFGLYDMAGNVWEWVSDWYRADYYQTLASQSGPVDNPKGPSDSFDPSEPGIKKRVMRGGSYLCTSEYCSRYKVGTRGKGEVDTGTNHLGFRCAQDLNR